MEQGAARPYVDVGVRSSPGRYVALLERLVSSGVVELAHRPGGSEVGLFTVKRKDGRQRVVIDARPANCFFACPPKTQLPTGSSFARVRAGDLGLFYSGLDLRDFFYQLSPPEALQPNFQLPRIRASALRDLGLCHSWGSDAWVFPRLQVAPMGWTHALDTAQRFFETLMSKALKIDRGSLLVEGRAAPTSAQGVAAVYVDNFIYVAESRA